MRARSCSGAGGSSVLNGLLNHSFMMHDSGDLPAATHAARDYPPSPVPHTNFFSASVPELADWADPLRQAAPARTLFPLKLGDLLPQQTASAGLLPGSGAIRGSVSLGDLRHHDAMWGGDHKPQGESSLCSMVWGADVRCVMGPLLCCPSAAVLMTSAVSGDHSWLPVLHICWCLLRTRAPGVSTVQMAVLPAT